MGLHCDIVETGNESWRFKNRVVIAAPESCPCCDSRKLSKLGEDITETLEVIPRQWKVIQTVRPQAVLRAGGYRGQCPARQERGRNLADRVGAVKRVRPASAVEPPERPLRPRGH